MAPSMKNPDKTMKPSDDMGIELRGMACRMPSSESTWKFWENLKNGVNMITVSDDHWEAGMGGNLPMGKGYVANQEFFDNLFFKISGAQAAKVDPQLRFLLELSYEALVDAGFTDLQKLRGSKTAVYVGSCFSDCHKGWLGDVKDISGYENTGCAQSMYANRLSFFFDFAGPSMNIDTACSSSLVALVEAVNAIELGKAEMAVVCGASITLHPGVSIAFNRLQMLSPDSACQAFSKNGNGYARSEGVAVVILTKENCGLVKQCIKEPYARLLGAGCNSDGFTKEGITFPNGDAQYRLYSQVRDESGLSIFDVDYIEAHGTGTQAGDGQEMEALRKAYCPDERLVAKTGKPLLIGSVKSNMGHSEGCSGLAGLVKVLLSYEQRMIPANLHYSYEERNLKCTALNDPVNGVKVVEKNTDFKNGGLVAVSSFGFGGTNAHIVIKGGPSVDKVAESPLAAYDAKEPWKQISPICARNEKCARAILSSLKEMNKSFENAISCPEVYGGEFPCHAYLNSDGEILTELGEPVSIDKRPVWYIFSGNGAMWPRMGHDLYNSSEIYRQTWDHCNTYMKKTYNCNSLDKFFREGPEVYDISSYDAIDGVVGLAAVQCGLIRILKSLGIEPDHMVGHSAGETAMGYADGILNLEQTMDIAYWRGYFGIQSVRKDKIGAMYACGLPRDKVEALFEKHNVSDASIACVNDPNMMTLSGSVEGLKPILNELKDMLLPNGKPVFVRRLETFGVAYHCSLLEPSIPTLRENLKKVIPNPKKRSKKWVSTCVDDDNLPEDDPLRYLSADYHCTNFREKVEFQRALSKCPENAIIIEIGPHSLFRGSAKKNVGGSHTYLAPMIRDRNSLHVFQQFYAQLWAKKIFCPGGKTLTPIEAFPGGENRSIRQLFFNWDHSIEYPLPSLNDMMRNTGLVGGGATDDGGIPVEFDFEENDKWMLDHVIDESVLFPGCGYLYAAWKAFQIHTHCKELAEGVAKQELSPMTDIVISKLKIPQGVRLDDSNRQLALSVKFNMDQDFEITYSGELIATGNIKILTLPKGSEKPANGWPVPFDDTPNIPTNFGDPLGYIEKHTFYNRVARNGYNYQKQFQLVEALDVNDRWAVVKFDEGYLEDESIHGLPRECDQVVANKFWASYLDNLLQVNLYKGLEDSTTLRVPTEIREVVIRGSNFYKCFPGKDQKKEGPECIVNGISPSSISNLAGNETANPFCSWGSGNNVFVQIQKHCNKVTSCLADISGLKLKIIARASLKKKAANTEVMTGQKLFYPLGSTKPLEMKSVDDAVQVMFEYSRLNLGMKNINVLDIDSTKFLGSNVVSYSGLDELFVKFNEQVLNVKEQYEKNFAGLYSEYTNEKEMGGKFNFLICSSDIFYKEGKLTSDPVKKHLQVPTDLTEFSSFALIHEDTEASGNNTPSDKQFTDDLGLIPVMRAVVGTEKLTLIKLPEITNEGIVFLNLMQKKTIGKGVYYDLSGETMINIIRPKIQSLIEDSKVNRVFIVSNSDGFPGFLKCLQSEPGDQMKICGVWVHSLPYKSLSSLPDQITTNTMTSGLPTKAIPQLSTETLQEIQRLGSQIVRVDATTGGIESELRCKSTSPTSYPAPHGVYTVFPNPGQLDEVAFKAQPEPHQGKERVKIAYSALNFRDIMLAYGKLDKDCLVGYSKNGDGWGLEYAGRVLDKNGKPGRRVVGLSTNCIGTEINVAKELLFDLKDDQDMAAFATVPCVYSTSYYALLVRAKMQPKDSVLIHAGTGGVGQSALNICLRRTQDPSLIFTTCSAKKRPYLLKKFGPLGLRPENVGNSRDISFEELIMERTSGRGVDIVLNSLDGESLQASWRCVAPFGRFCEIGKYDLMQNTGLPMQVFLKNISFLGIDLDQIMDMPEEWALIHKLVAEGIQTGEVQPLDRKVFEANEVTEAFRFMGAGTHVGKVLIKFGSEDENSYEKEPKIANIPNFSIKAPENHAFLIIGGLGGFGLEFAQWCSKHGVKKLILSSRGRVRNGNQARAIKEMTARGCNVEICNEDFTYYENVKAFVEKQPLAGLFNLGAVLADGLWKNMTSQGWETPCHAKTAVTDNFDRALRAANLKVDYFVTWSSVSAGHGNAGQTNYGYANSTLDAIVRRRNSNGEAGLSIQWGAISDVGLLAKEDSKSSGNVASAYMPQPMSSCLIELEKLLAAKSQGVREVYVSPKRTLGDGADSGSGNLPLKVAGIIGMANNMTEIENTPFENLGVDSLQVMEIQNSIKKAIGQKIPVDKLNKMTLKKLEELSAASA